MRIEYDEAKPRRTLDERRLDFADAGAVFDDVHVTRADSRHDYGEIRGFTTGMLGTAIVVVWTAREDSRRIISLRKAHDHERRDYRERVGRSG